jgi:putative ABC transport system permease protein
MGSTVHVGLGLAVALLLLVIVAAGLAWVASIATGRATVTAAVRAAIQLAAVSAIIGSVVKWLWAAALFGLVMLVVAAVTAGKRVTGSRQGTRPAALALVAGVVPVVAVVLATGTVPLTGIAVIPVVGIVIGGAMTATSLCGRRALDELKTRHGEYEAALALGFLPRDAAMEIARPAAGQALVPALDQTRTVGLVTLPGAFVGVLIGSGNPVQAGAAQLLVLIGLLAAETIAVVVTMELVARGVVSGPSRVWTEAPRGSARSRRAQ